MRSTDGHIVAPGIGRGAFHSLGPLLLLVSTTAAAGCTAWADPATGGVTGTGPALCTAPSPGAAPIRRLTRFEYSNTIRDLLGDTTRPGDLLPPEQKGNGFSNDAASLTTTRLLVDAYRSVGHDVAVRATVNDASVAGLTHCDAQAMGEEACARLFIDDFGRRAFRHPLDPTERDALLGVYTAVRQDGTATHADGVSAVIEMVLQAPQFLYRVEVGTPMDGLPVARPTGTEMASRLSYLLWGSTPDSPLLAAAAAGQLDTKEQILARAKVMLDDPRAREVVRYFHDTLFGVNGIDGLQRDATFFPTYAPSLAAMFRQETEQFVDSVIWGDGPGDFATLFTGSFTYVNGPLAHFYGLDDKGMGADTWQRVDLDPTQRAGILTQASILTATTPGSHNNPVVRGKFIYTQLLCGQVPDPPPGLIVQEPTPDPTQTMRQLFEAHRAPACSGCHKKLDAIGFGLEHYNGVGLWQDLDNGQPIDATGVVPDGDAAGPFDGAIELGKKIAASHDAQDCFVGKWLDFAYGRTEQTGDACTHASLANAFTQSKGNIRALLLALTQTDAFLYRPLSDM